MKKCMQTIALLAVAALLVPGALFADEAAVDTKPEVHSKTILSNVYTVDKIYPSMKGPQSRVDIKLLEGDPELVWVTGYKAVMVGPDGETQMPQDFMCHSNLDINAGEHSRAVGASHGFSPRLFTLSQGQFEIQLPEGFGIPMRSDETMALTTQVLNLNEKEGSAQVRHKVSINFVRDSELGDHTLTPLFPVGAYGLVLLEGESGHFGVQTTMVDEETHGTGCLPGDNAAGHTYPDHLGRVFTGHWVVKPGREVNNTLVTNLMRLPYDTAVHYIAVHLHPFAESLELRDLTTGETVFKSKARNTEGRIGLDEVEYFVSEEGIQLYKDHEYEMVSVYNNTTQDDQDSMAVMYLYVQDKMFDKSRVKIAGTKATEAPKAGGGMMSSDSE